MALYKNKPAHYVLINIFNNMGSDMMGNYFIRYEGNKKSIEKFLLINENQDYIKYYPNKKYTFDQVWALSSFIDLWKNFRGTSDNVELLMFTGRFKIPGENRAYSSDELEEWWETYLNGTKAPEWEAITDGVIDLSVKPY